MGAAQDRFKAVVRDHWAPALRDLGLTGSGKVFCVPDDHDWAMLGFQTSTGSTAEVAKFTVNLMVVGKDDWQRAREEHPWYSAKPSPNTVALHRYQQRLGFLTHGEDHWWLLLSDGSNEDAVAQEVLLALRDQAIPTLRAEMRNCAPGPRGTFAFRAR
ncbi:DUF4304 domain-containing protein [Nocardioides antri]|uniref:DUF4304 domain-containing protein n=1 Tax=Nocardioides antri TaxID=2607659 RepID=A0A5B1LRG7_9ACTN|nr:DUF4304 domain-containing protein [Nocardioides antri]KAA1423171.1 DUF4304 domain-containing protein [Nocardioides antri]